MSNTIYYVVGDIHGEIDSLRCLHSRIHRHHASEFADHLKTIVHLGDYIDRGPDSYDVIETVMELENHPDLTTINLKGNHEQLMLEAYQSDDRRNFYTWQDNGGSETLQSYRANGFEKPPQKHLDWVGSLRSIHWDQEAAFVFVHAGIDPAVFPDDDEQTHLWTRSRTFLNPENWKRDILENMTIVHGHSPTDDDKPHIAGNQQRINVDTGACFGGPLTAAVLTPDQPVQFLEAHL